MLTKLREFTYKHAIPSAIVIALLFYGLMQGVGAIFSLLPSNLAVRYIYEIVGVLYPIGIVILFGFSWAFRSKKFFKGLLCGMALLVTQIMTLLGQISDAVTTAGAWKPWYLILLGLISVLAIGIREECVFRATIQNIVAQKYAHSTKGIWLTAIVSALIFGLIHAFNIFSGVEVVGALFQATTNIGIGLFFAAVYLRSGSLWAVVAIHTLTDLAGLFLSIFKYKSELELMSSISWQSLIFGIVFIGISAFLLRPSKCKEIIERFKATANQA